jgi:hypothetical protein
MLSRLLAKARYLTVVPVLGLLAPVYPFLSWAGV